MKPLKTILVILSMCIGIHVVRAQNPIEEQLPVITLAECYAWAQAYYPTARQMPLIDKTTQYHIANTKTGNYPQLQLNGQATYQSDVPQLPIKLPNINIPTLANDQYKIYGEVYQPLTNFSHVAAKQNSITNKGAIEKQQLAVTLYQLEERIQQSYFGVLMSQERIAQLGIIQTDIDSALVRISAAIKNGTATLTDQRLLEVERISIGQQIEENAINKAAFIQLLATLTGKNITSATVFNPPPIPTPIATMQRPELKLFALQREATELQKKQNKNMLLPNVGLFLQGGYGRPALNFLKNDFDFYYIGGLRLNWNLTNFYTYKNTQKDADLSAEKLKTQEAAFLLNTNLSQQRQQAEIAKYTALVAADQQIIALREQLWETAKVQLQNGLITTLDFVRTLNEVSKAQQLKLLHETQRLMAEHALQFINGH